MPVTVEVQSLAQAIYLVKNSFEERPSVARSAGV